MKPKYLTLLALCALSAPAGAQLQGPRLNSFLQDDSGAVPELTASTAAPAQARPVEVITGDTMEKAGYASATDALSLLPGIFVRRTNAFGRADANIRGWGSDGQRIAVMVDGRPDKMSIYGCEVTQTLPLNNVERVEVVEGPASALYGSGAIGGAVNIVTRGAKKPFEGDVDLSLGSYNTRLARLRGGANTGNTDFYAADERRTSDGYTTNSAYEGNDYTAEYGRKFTFGSVRLKNKFYSGTEHDPAPVGTTNTTWFDYRRGALDLTGDYQSGDFTYKGRVFSNYGRHSFSDGWLSSDETYGAQADASWDNGLGATAKAGGEYYLLTGKRNDPATGAWDKREYSLYTNASLPYGKLLRLDGALRFTGNTGQIPVWVPGFALAVKPWHEVEFYASAAKGVRLPAINELYVFPVSNPNLKAETMWGYEAGAKYRPFEPLSLRGAAFMTEGDNLIQVSAGKLNNVGAFLFRGFLTDASYKFTDELSVSGSYTFLDPGTRTQGRPGHTATGGARFASDSWGLTADCLYAGKYYAADNSATLINDIFTVNARAWFNAAENIQLYAGVNNLLDRRYVVYATNTSASGLFIMPGIMGNLGVKYTF